MMEARFHMSETAGRAAAAPDKSRIQSVERAFAVLGQLAALRTAGVVQLAVATGLSPATVHRFLRGGLAQLAVGLTHAARGNVTGGARLLRRGAGAAEAWATGAGAGHRPHGIDLSGVIAWARELAAEVEAGVPVDAEARAPRLRGAS